MNYPFTDFYSNSLKSSSIIICISVFLLKQRAAIRDKDANLYEEELEALAQERASILNREFEWTDENIAKFCGLDTFLRDKMRLCYEKVRDADKK